MSMGLFEIVEMALQTVKKGLATAKARPPPTCTLRDR